MNEEGDVHLPPAVYVTGKAGLSYALELAEGGNTSMAIEIVEAAKKIESRAKEPDGPCGINQWRYNGEVLPGKITPKPYKLACHLFGRLGRKVRIADLIGDGRLFADVNDSTVQRHGSTISTWFVDQNVPLTVESGDGHIWMRHT